MHYSTEAVRVYCVGAVAVLLTINLLLLGELRSNRPDHNKANEASAAALLSVVVCVGAFLGGFIG